MATAAPQSAMEMPQQGANPFADPNTMAVYDQLRQTTSPKEFGDEMLAGASLVDPQAVAEFTQELQSLNIPPEVLDALNDVVDEILANPERYSELRAQYMDQGLPEEILPEQFDPQFFAALNMAIDQMIAAPSGVQSFAQGGIAELKPIAKTIASYGRNGDTMLAHITPAEARMLRRRGGSGTINPVTGLPEFFFKLFKGVGNALKGIGKAVSNFLKSSVGKLVTTVALGFFLGPAAASFLSVTSAAGVAAVSGFIGSAGSTLLGGGNLKDALKAGAIGGLTAGAGAGIMGGSGAFASGSYAGPTTIGGQVDKFKGMLPGGSPSGNAAAMRPPSPVAEVPIDGPPSSLGTNQAAPVPPFEGNAAALRPPGPDVVSPSSDRLGDFIQQNDAARAARAAANTPARLPETGVTPPKPGMFDQAKDFYNKNISPSGIQEAGREGAMNKTLAQFPSATETQVLNAPVDSVLGKAYASNMPGILSTYGPITAVGLGTMAAFGGFDPKPVEGGPITQSLMKPVTQRIQEGGTQRQMYSQGLPGVAYDEYGAPIFGKSVPLPTYDVPDYNSGGYGLPQERINLPPIYTSPPGTIGSRRVEQPYNNSDMYPNLVPRQYAEGGYAEGGTVTDLYRSNLNRSPDPGEIDYWKAQFGDEIDERERAVFRSAAGPELAGRQTEQKAARDAVAQKKAMRRSQGSGQMYSNINAGLAALAPETNPMYAGPVGDLYRDILRREPDAGGLEFWKSKFGDTVDQQERAAFQGAAAPEIAARNNFVGEPAYQTFGAQNRAAGLAGLQTAYGPMLQSQRDAMAKQKTILDNTATTTGRAEAGINEETRFRVPDDILPDGPSLNPPPPPESGPPSYRLNPPPPPEGGNLDEGIDHFGMDEYLRGARSGFGTAPPPGMKPYYQPANTSSNFMNMGSGMGDQPMEMAYRPGSMPPGMGGGIVTFGSQGQGSTNFMNMGGIATLGAGGYPRRTGQISGPGTEKSDSIPAMLSDGEFVMTAKAVRGAGKGSRRAGAKKMYALMHRLEKNSERG